MVEAGMEGTLDYENVMEYIAQLQYVMGRYDLGRKCIDECCQIYEQVYHDDPVRVGEQRERLQEVEDSLLKVLSKKKRLLISKSQKNNSENDTVSSKCKKATKLHLNSSNKRGILYMQYCHLF